jgi:X-Pro dipeptidyl-peptidase
MKVRDQRNIESLVKLNFLKNDSFLELEFLSDSLDNKIFKDVMSKIERKTDTQYNQVISSIDFFNIALELLGYIPTLNYSNKNIMSFAEKIGFSVNKNESYTNLSFFENVMELLKSKTKDGKDYFEMLCLEGVFSDYNKNKGLPEALIFNGKTQPIFDYNSSIFEKVYVEAPLDTDNDNKRDLLAVYIRRPQETNKGMKVPIIYIASPYMMWCNEDLYKLHNVDYNLEVFDETNIELKDIRYKKEKIELPAPREVKGITKALVSEEVDFDAITPWYNYFLARGYAIVFAGGIGTRGSDGVRTCGSSEETISTVSVIDWLNHRVNGFSNKTDNMQVKADWSNGKVGMTGKSYLGTLAIAAAVTGVEGLKTIVPESSISNWYEYYRCNGLNVAPSGFQGDDADQLAQYCFSRMFDPEDYKTVKNHFDNVLEKIRIDEDRVTGNYNKFWDERNYLNDVDKIKTSVFIVHGLRDWNVKPKQFDMLWKELEKNNIPRKMMLHQGAHIYMNNLKGPDFSDIMNKWYAHWLYEIDNGVMDELPDVTIQNNAYIDNWDTTNNWPFKDMEMEKFYIDANNNLVKTKNDYSTKVKITDDLAAMVEDRSNLDVNEWLKTIVSRPEIEKPYRLASTTDKLNKDTRISGTASIKIKASLDSKVGIISAMLVDYGMEYRPSLELKTVEKDLFSYGINAGGSDLLDFVIDKDPTDFNIITRGWMSVQNRRDNYNKDEVVIKEDYNFNFDMQPIDYTVLKGHRLGLIIYSTDAQFTTRQLKTTEFTIHKESISINIPMC